MACRNERGVPDSSGEYLALDLIGRVTPAGEPQFSFTQVLIVARDEETLHFLQKNMDRVARNVVKVKKAAVRRDERVGVGPEGFEKKIEAMLESMPETAHRGLFGNLAASMKKALLLLSLDRFHGNREMICKVLGISGRDLDAEMRLCGIAPAEQVDDQGKAR